MGSRSLAVVKMPRRVMRETSNNTLQKHFQTMVTNEGFMNEISNWLDIWGDKRLLILRHLVYEYGSCLTEKNYCGRKLFSMMAVLIGQIESGELMEA